MRRTSGSRSSKKPNPSTRWCREVLPLDRAWEQPTITLEGITPRAAGAIPETPFQITQFPFRIGRESADPLVYNDLMLPDSAPLQISRHHLAFIRHEGRVGVVDRGSTLGSWVDGRQVGGPSGLPGPMFFNAPEGLLVLGTQDSPFRYRVSLGTKFRRFCRKRSLSQGGSTIRVGGDTPRIESCIFNDLNGPRTRSRGLNGLNGPIPMIYFSRVTVSFTEKANSIAVASEHKPIIANETV